MTFTYIISIKAKDSSYFLEEIGNINNNFIQEIQIESHSLEAMKRYSAFTILTFWKSLIITCLILHEDMIMAQELTLKYLAMPSRSKHRPAELSSNNVSVEDGHTRRCFVLEYTSSCGGMDVNTVKTDINWTKSTSRSLLNEARNTKASRSRLRAQLRTSFTSGCIHCKMFVYFYSFWRREARLLSTMKE